MPANRYLVHVQLTGDSRKERMKEASTVPRKLLLVLSFFNPPCNAKLFKKLQHKAMLLQKTKKH